VDPVDSAGRWNRGGAFRERSVDAPDGSKGRHVSRMERGGPGEHSGVIHRWAEELVRLRSPVRNRSRDVR